MDNEPIRRDLKTMTGNAFGNITDAPNLANLMADPLGTDVVGGLTAPSTMTDSPSNVEETTGQPPQVSFMADGEKITIESLMSRVKALPSWTWLVATGAVGVGYLASRRK